MKALMVLLSLYLGLGVAHAQCPLNLDYVTQISWDTSDCRSIRTAIQLRNCRMALRTVFGIGLAQYLRDHSIFELPDNASAAACLNMYQQQLSTLGLASNMVQRCFKNTSEFVSSPTLCAGIQTKQNWTDKVGNTFLETACKGDVSSVSACRECRESRYAVHEILTNMIQNITSQTSEKCHYFVSLYAAGVVNELGPFSRGATSCILRIPFLHKTSSHRRTLLLYGLKGVAIGFLLLCSLWMGYCLWVRIAHKDEHRRYVRTNRSLLQRSVKPNTGAVWFNINDIKHATQNFSAANVIGEGGFGIVYNGTLPNGRQIAVKSIRECTSEGDSKFINEVEIINGIRHRNLVVLRGFCISTDDEEGCQQFLIYDYMANGSLDEHLHGRGNKNRGPLDWEQRRNIVIGTAKGLAYLHYGVQPAIYHRDIKPTNILLDDQMNACIADFGLARVTVEGQSHLTTRIAGSYGYLAPEYALYGQLTDRSDVYSFGVLLLEIMSGRKVLDTSAEMASDYLIADWAWKLVKADKTMQVIDRRIRESGPDKIMERFVLVGILCAHVMVAFRPSIVEALKMLEGDAEIPQIPDRPMPLAGYQCIEDENSSLIINFNYVFSS